jgi:hypothetical protein
MKKLSYFIFVPGLILLIINFSGLFMSMRNPELYTETNTGRINDVTIWLEDAKKQIVRKDGETDKAFAVRINDVVSRSMMHYYKKEGEKKYNLRVPVWENWPLWLKGCFSDDKRYEFAQYKKNLERGVGLCSTHSVVVKGILLDNGINASLWDIAGHVIVRAEVDKNEWWILDPDYGLVVEHDIPEIEADPELVRPAYAEMAKLYKPDYDDPYTTDHVVEIYEKEGNHIYDLNLPLEKAMYAAKWIIPFLLILPFLLIKLKKG